MPVLHHRGAQSAGRPLLSCSRADRNHDYTVSTVVIHLLPKLRHCTPSYAPAQRHAHTHSADTHVHTPLQGHTPTDKQILKDIWSFILIIFSLQYTRLCRLHEQHVAICTLRISLQQCWVTTNYYCGVGPQHQAFNYA